MTRSVFAHSRNCLFLSLKVASLLLVCSVGPVAGEGDVENLIHRMETAYAAVDDYQAMTTVQMFKSDGTVEIQKFLYSFKKPNRVRMDFQTPHAGSVLCYPDDEGKVKVRLAGIAGIFPLHLSLDNPRIVSSGQRIDQTDLGLLIANIVRSVTEDRKGPVSVTEEGGLVHLEVLAPDHFLKDVTTLYRFSIDKALSLPVGVEDLAPGGFSRRIVTFKNLMTNRGLSDRFMAGDRKERAP